MDPCHRRFPSGLLGAFPSALGKEVTGFGEVTRDCLRVSGVKTEVVCRGVSTQG